MSAKLVLSQSGGGFSFVPVFGPAREWYEYQQQANGDILFRRVVDDLDSFGMPRPPITSPFRMPNPIPPFGGTPPFGTQPFGLPRPIAPPFGMPNPIPPFGNPPNPMGPFGDPPNPIGSFGNPLQ